MAEFDVDLFVIGGGSGGVRAARIAAGYGARVMVAEEYRMGGTCVIRGCVPKKLFVIGSHIHHEIEDAAGLRLDRFPQVTFDWPTLVANKDKEIARLEAASTPPMSKRSGARIVKTRAVFEDAHTLRLANGETVTAKYILIATGGAPNHGTGDPRHRARDFVERGVSSAGTAEARRDPGRRLYRAGVRRHLRRLRLRRHGGLSRRQYPARLRRGRPQPCARRDGKAGHHHSHRLHRRQGRQARQRIHLASVERLQHRLRSGDVCDRAASECRRPRPGKGRRRDQSRTMAASRSMVSRGPRCRTSTRSATSPIASI